MLKLAVIQTHGDKVDFFLQNGLEEEIFGGLDISDWADVEIQQIGQALHVWGNFLTLNCFLKNAIGFQRLLGKQKGNLISVVLLCLFVLFVLFFFWGGGEGDGVCDGIEVLNQVLNIFFCASMG